MANTHNYLRKFGSKTGSIMYSDYGKRIQKADVLRVRANQEIVGCVWFICRGRTYAIGGNVPTGKTGIN